MFIIVLNGDVKFGPEKWNKFLFESVLKEDYNITTTLPLTNKNVMEINNICKIYPIKEVPVESFNGDFYLLEGPFWTLNESYAEYSFNKIEKPLEEAKNVFKNKIASKRWIKENENINVTINNKNYSVSTKRENRDIFLKKYLVLNDNETTQWKFTEEWVELTKLNLKEINDFINSHVEQQFIWEKTKCQEIDNCQNIEELKTYVNDDSYLE